MATGALCIASRGNVVCLGRCPHIARRRDVTAGATGSTGMVHRRWYPRCIARVAGTAEVITGHWRGGVGLGTADRHSGSRSAIVAGRAVGRSGHPGVGEGGRRPNGRSMATGALRIRRG